MTSEEIGERLADLRIDTTTGKTIYTQRELAKKLGLSHAAIGYYETGVRSLPIKALKAYHHFFKVSYEYLLGESDSKKIQNIKVQEELGLSERAIDVLRVGNMMRQKTGSDNGLLETLNFMVEGAGSPEVNYDDLFDASGQFKDPQLAMSQRLLKSFGRFNPIFYTIYQYLTMSFENNRYLKIYSDGLTDATDDKFKVLGTGINENELIEYVLLMKIQERLKELKEQWDLS